MRKEESERTTRKRERMEMTFPSVTSATSLLRGKWGFWDTAPEKENSLKAVLTVVN